MQEKIFYAVHNVFRKKNFDRDQQFFFKLPFKNTIELEKNLAPSPKIYK